MPARGRRTARSPIDEFGLIRTLRERYPSKTSRVVRGIGDDAAVIVSGHNRRQLLTTDLLVEGIHFNLRTAGFADVGFRAAAANLSDIAAMGGTPEYVLVSLAMPRSASQAHVDQLYRGIMAACRPHDVRLIGGDTSASGTGWFINVTLVGSSASPHVLLRSGARPGDDLYVTGTLGDSRAGLQLLAQPARARPRRPLPPRHRRFLVNRHLRPTPRIREGRWLLTRHWATAAIDISDGLSGDVRHLCEESDVGVDLDLSAVPVSAACRVYATAANEDPAMLALAGGEDYELLFTVPVRHRARFQRATAVDRIHATRIGAMTTARQGLHVTVRNGRRRPLPFTSYEHFSSKT